METNNEELKRLLLGRIMLYGDQREQCGEAGETSMQSFWVQQAHNSIKEIQKILKEIK